MAHLSFPFESVPSVAVRRRLSSSVDAKQKPNIPSTYASLTASLMYHLIAISIADHALGFLAHVGGCRWQRNQQQYRIRNGGLYP